MTNTTWILVGNASRARLFTTSGKRKPWSLLREFQHPQSRAKGTDIMADRPGRMPQSAGINRPGMEPPTPPKEVEAERFAQELVSLLEQGHGRNQFDRLVLAAPPQFLGLLRRRLSNPARKRIAASVDKDYTQLHERDLPERLMEFLQA